MRPVLVVLVALAAACGGSGDDGGGDGAAPESEVLRILVTNDDGVGGEGIDALVRGLETLPDVEVTVVAPAEDRSGTSDSTSNPPPTASEATLIGGHEAIAVAGYPADSVIHGLDQVMRERPHVVVSGVNLGQNLGPVAYASGTVGAARTAARRGIPALAVSQGLGDTVDYETGVRLTLDWIQENRRALLTGDVSTDSVANLNVPSCATGELRGVVEVDSAVEAGTRNVLAPANCTSTIIDPADDVEGFLNGYATLSDVPIDPPS